MNEEDKGYWGLWLGWFVPRFLLVMAALIGAGLIGAAIPWGANC